MSYPNTKKTDSTAIRSMLATEIDRLKSSLSVEWRNEFKRALKSERKMISQEIVQTGAEVANAVLEAVQKMFDEQNQKNEVQFATKIEVQIVKEDVEELKEKVTQLETKVDRNYNLLVSVVGDIKSILENQTASSYRQTKHTDQLADHEIRLGVVETHLQLAT